MDLTEIVGFGVWEHIANTGFLTHRSIISTSMTILIPGAQSIFIHYPRQPTQRLPHLRHRISRLHLLHIARIDILLIVLFEARTGGFLADPTHLLQLIKCFVVEFGSLPTEFTHDALRLED